MGDACFSIFPDYINQPVIIGFTVKFFLEQDSFRTIGNSTPKRNITCRTAHNFHHAASLMGIRRFAEPVYCLHRRIYSCIKTNRIICIGYVQINCPWNPNNIYAIF